MIELPTDYYKNINYILVHREDFDNANTYCKISLYPLAWTLYCLLNPTFTKLHRILLHTGDMNNTSPLSAIILFIPTLFLHIPYPQPSRALTARSTSYSILQRLSPFLFLSLFLKSRNYEVRAMSRTN